ncbi:C6 transcription factor [Pseudohyphozyma bogoriensis]|nr:C6 transcription factor [Pseudohyphozyma bogoriensis]
MAPVSPPELHDPGGQSDVSEPSGPKIERVKRACVLCFKAKVRCSGAEPCGRCVKKSFSCFYNPLGNSRASGHRKRRRPPAEPNVGAPKPAPVPVRVKQEEEAEEIVQQVRQGSVEAPTPPIVVRQPFFRWLGLTSVAPPPVGAPFRSHSVAIRSSNPSASTASNPSHSPSSSTPLAPKPSPPITLASPRDPIAELAESTARIRVFYELFESYLPFMPLEETLEQARAGTLSEVVVVAMSALVKRMRPDLPCPSAEKLADRAKALVIPHLALPSLDSVYALLLLAYHEHGADRDSGLWAYSGMAIRMSIDLGLHKARSAFESEDAAQAALRSRVFWGVLCLDRIISCGTGRATTIPLLQIEIPLPPPRTHILTSSNHSLPDPFPFLCRLLLLLGDVSDTVNTNLSPSTAVNRQVPQTLQVELAEYQLALPSQLHFSVHTFSAYVSAGHAQVFLLLSIWHQAVHLAIHEAALLFPQFGTSTTATGYGLSSLSGSSSISIADMLAYSDVILSDAFLCTPVTSQPILMAARAASSLLKSTLERIQLVWKGLSWHLESMRKEVEGDEVDLSKGGEGTITSEDRGVVARAKIEEMTRGCTWLSDELRDKPKDGEVVGVGVSMWGMTTELPHSSLAVLRSGRSSPLLWNGTTNPSLNLVGTANGLASNSGLSGEGNEGMGGVGDPTATATALDLAFAQDLYGEAASLWAGTGFGGVAGSGGGGGGEWWGPQWFQSGGVEGVGVGQVTG